MNKHTPCKFDQMNSLTSEQMKDVDRIAIEEFGIDQLQLMEMAGYQVAALIRRLEKEVTGKKVLVLVGPGNNGADGLVTARYLANWGAELQVLIASRLNQAGIHQIRPLKKMDVSVRESGSVFYQSDIVIDGLFGYSLRGTVRNPYVELIESVLDSTSKVYSVDIPSGLDANDGSVGGIAVKADATVTLAYPKKGLFMTEAAAYVGDLYVADIGIPDRVYTQAKNEYPDMKYENLFIEKSIIKIN